MGMGPTPEVVLLFKLRDEVSSQLAVVNQRLDQTEAASNRVNRSVRSSTDSLAGFSRNMLMFGAAALLVASSVARLAVRFGLLNEEQAEWLQDAISMVSAIAGVATAVGTLVLAWGRIGPLLTTATTAVLAFVAAWGAVAAVIAGVVAVLVGAALALEHFGNKLTETLDPRAGGGKKSIWERVGRFFSLGLPTGPQSWNGGAPSGGGEGAEAGKDGWQPLERSTNPRPDTGRNSEWFRSPQSPFQPRGQPGASLQGGGGAVVVNFTHNGTLQGNEAEARNFAREIARLMREDNRARGTTA